MRNNIKVFRAMNDMTQQDLAEKAGVTRQTILDPSLSLAFKISRVFNVNVEDVFFYD
jgi:putative transcriptional regulator